MNRIVKHSKIFILITWVASTLTYLYMFGIYKDLEAEKYINEAHYLIKNFGFSSPRYWFYAITVFILALSFSCSKSKRKSKSALRCFFSSAFFKPKKNPKK